MQVGPDALMRVCEDGRRRPEEAELQQVLRPSLLRVFPAALLGRMVVVPYYPLSDEVLGRIVRLQLGRIRKRVEARYRIPFECSDDVVRLVISRCTESESGGRMIDAILTNTMLPDLSREFLNRMLDGVPIGKVSVGVSDGQFSYSFD